MNFEDFAFVANMIGSEIISWISQTSELKSWTESFLGSTCLFILMESVITYLYSFRKQPAANFFKNNSCFPHKGKVGHHANNFTEAGFDLLIMPLKGHFMRIFAALMASLVYLSFQNFKIIIKNAHSFCL